ncbi:MAG TPA: sigma-70 family RNA polymerase sigma factor [Candidatus Acidoferrum sp.]
MFLRAKAQLESFEAAAMPHLTDLYRTASLVLRDPHEAEDLIQETYLEAWKSFHRFELGTNCRAWLFKIMFHRLHHVRRRLVKTSRVITIDASEGQAELAAEPTVPQEIRDEEVLRALEKVAVEFREVVLLADVEEFSYKEIAETLKIPLGTVMSRLSRGRKLLRQDLAEVARSYGINPRTKTAGGADTA